MILSLLLIFLGTCFSKCEDDTLILFLTVPKCGSTFVQKVVSEVVADEEGNFLGEGANVLGRFGIPRFRHKGLLFYHSHLIEIKGLYSMVQRNPSLRVFVNLRDPRDAIVSFRDYVEYKLEPARAKGFLSLFAIDWEIWKKASQYEKLEIVIASSYLDQFRRALEFIQLPNVCVVRYEYLVGERGGGSSSLAVYEAERLLTFLGLKSDEGRIQRLLSTLYGRTQSFYKGKIGRGIIESKPELERMLQKRLSQEVYFQLQKLTSISHKEE